MMTKKTAGSVVTIVVMTLFVIGALFMVAGMSSASADNLYVGAWESDWGDIRMDLYDDRTVQVVYPDDPSTGYYYEYIFGDDGELIVLDDGSAVLFVLGMFDYNTLGDTDGGYWYRIA